MLLFDFSLFSLFIQTGLPCKWLTNVNKLPHFSSLNHFQTFSLSSSLFYLLYSGHFFYSSSQRFFIFIISFTLSFFSIFILFLFSFGFSLLAHSFLLSFINFVTLKVKQIKGQIQIIQSSWSGLAVFYIIKGREKKRNNEKGSEKEKEREKKLGMWDSRILSWKFYFKWTFNRIVNKSQSI